jgi:tripartite-type tricarboxylate transporter receptor subunit TctC
MNWPQRFWEPFTLGLRIAMLGLALPAFAGAARCETYPARPVHIIVPQVAGGANDIVARLLQAQLQQELGQPIVIENRTGASGIVASDYVAKASPDGYTLGITFATFTVNPAVNEHMPFDTERDLAPVILIGKNPLLFLVNAKMPVKTLPEFIALAKANPGKFNYATPGAASQAHLLMADLCRRAGIEMQNLPFRGGAPAIMATVAGDAQLALISPLASNAQIQAGTLRPIATGSLSRDAQFPDVPAVAETFPGYEAVAWIGVFTTAGVPRAVIDRLNTAFNRVIRIPEIAAKLDEQGVTVAGGTPEAFGTLISSEIKRYTETARLNHITAE